MRSRLLIALMLCCVALGDVTWRVGGGPQTGCCGEAEAACCCLPDLPVPGGSCCQAEASEPATCAVVAGCGCGADHGPGLLVVHRTPPKTHAEEPELLTRLQDRARLPFTGLALEHRAPAPETPPPRTRGVRSAA